MPRTIDKPLLKKIAALYCDHKTYAEIMEETGKTKNRVRNYVRKAKDAGLAPESRYQNKRALALRTIRNSDRRRGNVSDMLLLLMKNDDVLFWVMSQVPKGGSIAEFAGQCVIDAYYEENGE